MDPIAVPAALEAGEAIREAVPARLLPAFVAVTRLGNVGVFLAVFAYDYWFSDHRRGAHAIGIVIAGMAVITLLKSYFAAPRPPESVNAIPISGFAFPSGHATGAAIAYGVLAYDFEIGGRRVRYAAAGLLIALVALSRVVLGVHYVRDVVAGVAVGLGFLVVAVALTRHAPRPSFLLAIGLGVAALVTSEFSHDGVSVLGAAIGAALVWESLDEVPRVESLRERAVLLGVAFPALAAVGYLSTREFLPLPITFLLNAAVLAGLLGAPVLATRVDRSPVRDRARPESG